MGNDRFVREPIDQADPDEDVQEPTRRRAPGERPAVRIGVVSAGGVIGSVSRYGVSSVFPEVPGTWPWITWAINVGGCLLIGMLAVLIDQRWSGRRLLHPFLVVGVLGGFTTFSTAMVETQQLLFDGAVWLAMSYWVGTALAALVGVAGGAILANAGLNLAERWSHRGATRYADPES